MNRNGKKIVCLLAAFMLFTNSSITSVYAEEESDTNYIRGGGGIDPLSETDLNAEKENPFIPGNSVFSVEKEVDTAGIASLFSNDIVFKDNIKELMLDFEIRNLATHYGSCTVEQMEQKANAPGAVMYQEDIADYGSVTSGKAEPANGARFSRYANASDGSQIPVGVSNGNTVTNNSFCLRNNQKARFTNKFRRGSYIVLEEKTSDMMKALSGLSRDAAEQLLTDVFDISYTVYNKDTAISQADLQKSSTWVTESSLSSLSDMKGTAVNDGRREKSSAGASDSNGTPIGDTKITSQPASAVLFRDYTDPDNETSDIDVRVKYTNRFKTGVIAITKAPAAGSDDLTGTYSFTIAFDNVAGIRLEDTYDSQYQILADRQIQRTFTLKTGETKVFTDIPAGTEYTIKESDPADGSTLQSVTDSLADGTAYAGVGRDTAVISDDKVVTGKITADDSTSVVQTFTFYNMKEEAPVPTPTPEPTPTPTPAEKPKNPSSTNTPAKKPTAANSKKAVSSKEVVKNSQKLDSGVSAGWKGNTFKLSWKAVQGAGGYDIFVAQCGKKLDKKSLVKTVKQKKTSVSLAKAAGKKFSGKKNYKAMIKAWKYIDGKKVYIGSSKTYHVAGRTHKKYTNAKKLNLAKRKYTLKKGKSVSLKVRIVKQSKKKKLLPKGHGPSLWYFSDNKKVAAVTSKGKVTAKGKGTCYIYVTALNGINTKIKITVK